MTRNCEKASTVRPGKSASRCARITEVSSTKACWCADKASGRRITRGSTRGTLTMAMWLSRPKASLPPSLTMKLSDLLATCGNGCAGSRPTGTSSGRTCDSKKILHPGALRLIALRMVDDDDLLRFQGRHHRVVEDAVLLVHDGVRLHGGRSQVLTRDAGAGQVRGLQHVGKAHLEELVHVGRDDADVAQTLQQGHVGPGRLGQHAPVELQHGLLATQQGHGRMRFDQRREVGQGGGQGSRVHGLPV